MVVKDILESISYISNAIMAIVMIIGLSQIRLTKTIAEATNKRESHRLALNQCALFQAKVIPLFTTAIKFYEENGITILDEIEFDKNEGTIKIKISNNDSDNNKVSEFLNLVMIIFNEMDSFASYFTNKIADEHIAFGIQGIAYCDIIIYYKKIYDLFMLESNKEYKSLIELFELWSIRINQELISDKKRL